MRRKLLNSKMVPILAALLMLFMAVGVAEAEKTDASGQWKYELVDGGATITGYVEEPEGDLVIPGELDGYLVAGIGDSAFFECLGLISAIIPKGVTSIGPNAFGDCSGLTSVDISESVTSIGDFAFSGSGLTAVTIPDSVTTLGGFVFAWCALPNVTVPDSVIHIEGNVFAQSSLRDIYVSPDNPAYTQVGGVLFDKQLRTVVAYPGGREGGYAIPEGVTCIGDSAFDGCGGLTDITIPDSVTTISDYAFVLCTDLAAVTIPDGVTAIGDFAFFRCNSLAKVIIPASVTEIGRDAFFNCELLVLSVGEGSYAEQYAKENNIPYVLTTAVMADDEAFIPIGGSTFTFSSGTGGWSTEVTISEDGSFTGHFHDSDMGDDGDDYPEGTRYECFFSGVFVMVGKIDPFTYELRLSALDIEEDAGVERIEDGVRVIRTGAYGIENGDVFMLYCPGRATADLPENFLEWMSMPNAWEEIPDALPFYGLYNSEEELGFFSYAEP